MRAVSFLWVSPALEGRSIPKGRTGAGPGSLPRAQKAGAAPRAAAGDPGPRRAAPAGPRRPGPWDRALPFSSLGGSAARLAPPAPRVSFQASLCPAPDWQVLLFRLNNPAAQWLRVADVGGGAGE